MTNIKILENSCHWFPKGRPNIITGHEQNYSKYYNNVYYYITIYISNFVFWYYL